MKSVSIYTTETCGYCKMAKEFFLKNNVEFQEFDVGHDLEKRQEMIEKSGQILSPYVEINGRMLADISGEEVEAYLLANNLAGPNDRAPEAPINAPCAHELPSSAVLEFRR